MLLSSLLGKNACLAERDPPNRWIISSQTKLSLAFYTEHSIHTQKHKHQEAH
jgi:hypothetical protein